MTIYDSLYPEVQPGLSLRAKAMAAHLAAHGCNGFKFPPFLNTKNPQSLGYDPRTDLDVGQWGPLHLTGTADDLLDAIKELHACGLVVIQDWVNRQMGGPAPMYERGADGTVNKSLFPKFPACFAPPSKLDVPFDPDNGANDGILVSYGALNGYMLKGKQQAGRWLDAALCLDGFRLDEAKGLSPAVSRALTLARPGHNVAEVYTGDPTELQRFVKQVGMPVLDFTRHFAYRAVSQGASLRSLPGNGFCFWDPDHAWVYVESNDTDGEFGIVNNKLWFYLDALTIPCKAALIYAGDYERYGLAPHIDNLMWISPMAVGAMAYEFVDDTLIAWSRNGDGGEYGHSGGLFCGFSSDPINHRSEWIHTPFPPNTHLHDYAGHGPDVWTNADGWGYFTFGPNGYGSAQNYVAYAPAGIGGAITQKPIPHNPKVGLTDFSGITLTV